MTTHNATLLALVIGCSLLAAGPALWIALRWRTPGAAALAGFLAAAAISVAAAWVVGMVLNFTRPPYLPTAKPGNFSLPMPWPIIGPLVQAISGAPTIGVVVAVVAGITVRRRQADSTATHQ